MRKNLSGIQRVKSFMKHFIFCGMIFTHIQYKIDGEKVETVTEFMFLGSKISVDGDCSHKIKRCLHLRRKVMTNLDSVLKSRDVTLLTMVCLVIAMAFPVVMYGHELNHKEGQRIDAFEMVLEKILESLLDNKEFKPVNSKGNQP